MTPARQKQRQPQTAQHVSETAWFYEERYVLHLVTEYQEHDQSYHYTHTRIPWRMLRAAVKRAPKPHPRTPAKPGRKGR